MKQYKFVLIAILFALGIGYGVGRHLQPAEIKTEIKEVEKIVEKIKKDIVIVEREVRQPDGTVIVDRETRDRSEEAIRRDTRREEETEINNKAQWKANIHVKSSISNLVPQYGASVERRILGPVWVGVGAYQDGTANVSVGWEF